MGCVRAMVAAVEAWLVAQPSVRRCQVACRCSSGAAAAHDRPPTPTALDAHKCSRDYQSRPTDNWGEVCALGWLPWWESVHAALSSHRSTFKSQGRIRGRIGPDKAVSYQTIAPKHILRRDCMRVMRPKPVPGVARSIEMAPSKAQCVTARVG